MTICRLIISEQGDYAEQNWLTSISLQSLDELCQRMTINVLAVPHSNLVPTSRPPGSFTTNLYRKEDVARTRAGEGKIKSRHNSILTAACSAVPDYNMKDAWKCVSLRS